MRCRRLTPAAALFVAACASNPTPPPVATSVPTPVLTRGGLLVGLSAADLMGRFGTPVFQVREGAALKLQWANNACVLDAYLYPPAGSTGGERVTHVDARRPAGDDLDPASCATSLAR